jgi:23S rRNA pseudouridine1911/1915/1917 synthase
MIDRITMTAVAGAELRGLRLDQAAAVLFSEFSRARIQRWIRDGDLTVDGQASKATYRISGGESLGLDTEPERQQEVQPQNIKLELIHTDDDIIVLNKPAGLVVHPAAGHPDGTLQNGLLYFDAGLAAIPRSGIVHRLDKDTSGVMVVARSLRAHNSLVAQLQSRKMSRIYQAIATGTTAKEGSVDAAIGRHPRDRKRMAVVLSGRPAVSHYRLIRDFGGFSHLEVSLETGRTHQIRVHMAHLGHPLVGDPLYGRSFRPARGVPDKLTKAIRGFPRQALHAFRLRLMHPATNEHVEFSAAVPDDIQGLLDILSEAYGPEAT